MNPLFSPLDPPKASATKVVLLSERDDALRRALGRALSVDGFSVITVANLARAVAYLDEEFENDHSDALPDVIVADIPPWGPEHDAAVSLVRRLARRVPVVAMTDLGASHFFLDGRRISMIEVVEKPIHAADLRAAMLRVQARQLYH